MAWLPCPNNACAPLIGKRPVAEIDAPEVLTVLKRIDSRGARFTAHKIRGEISRAFRYGIKEGYCKLDPARDLVNAIPPAQTTHFASITEPAKVGAMLRAFDGFSGTFPVLCALKLAPMLFTRPGELRKAEWAQFDLDKGEWRYLVTKTSTEHLVPLATQAVQILRELHALTGHGRYVFRTVSGVASDRMMKLALRVRSGLARKHCRAGQSGALLSIVATLGSVCVRARPKARDRSSGLCSATHHTAPRLSDAGEVSCSERVCFDSMMPICLSW